MPCPPRLLAPLLSLVALLGPQLLHGLASLVFLALPVLGFAGYDEPARVGVVGKVENEAEIESPTGRSIAVVGSPVHMKERLRTGPQGRLLVIFRDDTELTLGENAVVVIDRYVYDPDKNFGETVLQATHGAFRFALGRIDAIGGRNVSIATPVATIGVRGTEFWGGPIDSDYGVLLLDGEIVVSNPSGSVTLAARGQGTNFASSAAPPAVPSLWSEDKIARAVATVALH